jgi:hydrogenase maturation protein HypF
MDGLGLGTDGTIWGGEFLVGGYGGFERAGHFSPVALPGGAQAMREPWRNAVAHLKAAFGNGWRDRISGSAAGAMLDTKQMGVIERMIDARLNAPLSSSAGRLFDAAAAALGIAADRQHYEGQAAMEMETLAAAHLEGAGAYPVAVSHEQGTRILSWAPLWGGLTDDLKKGVEPGVMAARFHLGFAAALTETAAAIADRAGTRRIALSGGVMQNRILLEVLHNRLTSKGFEVLVQSRVPANDGGLSLGQAAIASFLGRQ